MCVSSQHWSLQTLAAISYFAFHTSWQNKNKVLSSLNARERIVISTTRQCVEEGSLSYICSFIRQLLRIRPINPSYLQAAVGFHSFSVRLEKSINTLWKPSWFITENIKSALSQFQDSPTGVSYHTEMNGRVYSWRLDNIHISTRGIMVNCVAQHTLKCSKRAKPLVWFFECLFSIFQPCIKGLVLKNNQPSGLTPPPPPLHHPL